MRTLLVAFASVLLLAFGIAIATMPAPTPAEKKPS